MGMWSSIVIDQYPQLALHWYTIDTLVKSPSFELYMSWWTLNWEVDGVLIKY